MLGGPAMAIGLGGGAASSMASGSSSADLDFASVQRSNPEMERRCQEVIDRCWAQGKNNPILSVHDVGAGGLSNALPELVHDSERGGKFELRNVPNDEPGMSPLAIWCNESQERYVLAVKADELNAFEELCTRERCPFAVMGEVTKEKELIVSDATFKNNAVNVPLELLFGEPPKMVREVESSLDGEGCHIGDTRSADGSAYGLAQDDISEIVQRVLRLPTVASKSFLITIGDRSITGQVVRDQMVGPWQVPVADVAVTASDYHSYFGEAMAMGERPPVALVNPAASARLAVGEAITNIAAAHIEKISDIKLSANWMAAANYPGEDKGLFEAVKAVGMELCPALGITIPVGKDSLSMRTVWKENNEVKAVVAPLSLNISAFAPVVDIRKTLTPQLRTDCGETVLLLIDLSGGRQRLGGSALMQVFQEIGDESPDVDANLLKEFFAAIQTLNKNNLLLAYHDRSDGGLFVTLCEMAFAGHCGLDIDVSELGEDVVASLFNEELGAVIQIKSGDVKKAKKILKKLPIFELGKVPFVIPRNEVTKNLKDPSALPRDDSGSFAQNNKINIFHNGKSIFSDTRVNLHRMWAETSYHMQALRDNPDCAKQEFDRILDESDPGLSISGVERLSSRAKRGIFQSLKSRPHIAILREQGVNGQLEMAAAFDRAGFKTVDVHMTDILSGKVNLKNFKGLVACGGFSYGDVLGAGQGWAKSILCHPKTRDEFKTFFHRDDTFALGVCNGCQMFSYLKELIPGAEHWPKFKWDESGQFEGRVCLVEVQPSPSLFFKNMEGWRLPVPVAHGEGLAVFDNDDKNHAQIALRYVDNYGKVTETYPANPNGSPEGITGLTTTDGRVTIMMPHPERAHRSVCNSWHPDDWGEDGPWMQMFYNAAKER